MTEKGYPENQQELFVGYLTKQIFMITEFGGLPSDEFADLKDWAVGYAYAHDCVIPEPLMDVMNQWCGE